MTTVRRALAAAALTVAVLTIPASAAGAAEFGSDCSANQIAMSGFIMVPEQTEPGSPFPVAAPFAGVMTSWTSRGDAFGVEPNVGYMKVLRPAKPGEFTVIGESTSELVGPGTHTHPVRIAIEAGDRVGLFGTEGSFYCETNALGNLVWSLNRNLAIGSSSLFAANSPGLQVPVSATVEPDADKDGFGDETQDSCPQLATVHEVPCPSLTLSFFSLLTKKAVLVYVSAGTQAKVTVTAKAGKKLSLKPLEHLADPGLITKYKLPLSAALLKKLGATPRSKSLGLKVTASGVNAAGIPKSETRTLRLKGRA